MERSGLRFEHFCLEVVYNCRAKKKGFFYCFWRTKHVENHASRWRPLVEGYITNFGIYLDFFEFLRFGWFFPFFKKLGFLAILGPPYCGIGATTRIGREMICLPYAGFLYKFSICISFSWRYISISTNNKKVLLVL